MFIRVLRVHPLFPLKSVKIGPTLNHVVVSIVVVPVLDFIVAAVPLVGIVVGISAIPLIGVVAAVPLVGVVSAVPQVVAPEAPIVATALLLVLTVPLELIAVFHGVAVVVVEGAERPVLALAEAWPSSRGCFFPCSAATTA